MELIGTVKKKFDVQTFSSGFRKQELILLTQEQYPQPISIEFLSEKIDLLNSVSEGDQIKIGINIRGREWQNPEGQVKYFNSITAWKLEKMNAEHFNEPTQATALQPGQSSASQDTNVFDNDDEDDLPF